jgi:hypothetical protein
MLTKQVQAIELNIADAHALEENLNLQIEAAVALVLNMVSMLNQSLLSTTGREWNHAELMIRLKTLFILGQCKRFTEKSSCKCLTPKYYCLKIT